MDKLHINNLHVSIGGRKLIKGLDLSFSGGSFNALVGPNGAGKSTLLKAICNTGVDVQGEVLFGKKDLHKLHIQELSKTLSYMGQFSNTPELSVWDILALGRRVYSPLKLSKYDHELIEEMAEKMQIIPWLGLPISSLSGGERQKVFILSALLQEPKILLLDEPISHLDPKNQHLMLELVAEQTKKKDLITIIVLHDIHHALHYADEIVMLKKGNLIAQKSSEETNEQDIERLFDMPLKMYEVNGHKFIYYKHSHYWKD